MKKFIRSTTTAFLAGTGFAFVMFSATAPTSRAWASPLQPQNRQSKTSLSEAEREAIADRYSYVDPDGLVPSELLTRALVFFETNRNKIENQNYISIVNTTANQKTLFVINLQDGYVGAQELDDSTQALSGFYLMDELPTSGHSSTLKIKSIASGRTDSRWMQLAGLGDADREGLLRILKGGSVLFAGSSMQETAVQMASATASASAYTVQTPPLWESKRRSDGRAWTLFSFDVVKNDGPNLMAGARDVQKFCPNYSKLTQNQKMNFWVYLVSAVVKYESGFNPLSRYRESTMGTDSVTGRPVYSEGLMQLSYQDVRGYPFCEFNWAADKYLSPTDPKKTILDPYKNLKCGIRILNQIVKKNGLIAFNSGQYWSTLQPKNSTERAVQSLTNTIPFCRR